MKCPECGANCWRDSVDVGVGVISDEWKCEVCDWTEDVGFPMDEDNWKEWLDNE